MRVFENRVLKKIFGSKMEEVVGGWKRLHNEELHNMYNSQNFIRVIKSTSIWAGHVARIRARKMFTVSWLENPKTKTRDNPGYRGVVWRMILKWILVQ
jgi:metal-dependent hydrolase (beta-lactamase superfamily II)